MTTCSHHSFTFLNYSFFISIVFGYAFSMDNINLSSTESFTFSSNRTIVSPGKIFELGIFKPDYSSQNADHWYLGIWFQKISERTYVWVANRNQPLSYPVGTIRVWNSQLALFDQSNILMWSTAIREESEVSPLVAELLDDGNFMLRRSNISDHGDILWQSFDFPTDTLLPGMKFGWKQRPGNYEFLKSWENITDPSTGNFSYGIEFTLDVDDPGQSQGYPTMFLKSDGKQVNRISPWNGAFAVGVLRNKTLINFTFTLIAKPDELTFSFQISDSEYTSIMKLSAKGYVQHLIWNETSSVWDTLWSSPNQKCDIYKFCGPYTYCDMSDVCYCMRGFEPKNPKAWALQNRGDGCARKKPLSCNEYNFFKLINIKLPDYRKALVHWEIRFDECKQRCVTDCSCTGFTIVKQIVNNSTRSGCVIWIGELLDVQQYVTHGHDLYVKQANDKKLHTKLIIGLSVFALGCAISIILFCNWRRNKKRKRARGSIAVATSIGHLSGEDIVENLELPLMSFETIIHATDNFSVSNKLGEGGFGTVYKGKLLDNQEIAVKRLSMISGQGIDEFKNELMLITKVQHVNLVRLFGYCINGDEKLLIYEYLENRSLDLYLFDETQSCKIDWPGRYKIVVGIARGLSYLHEDSAVRIIHRDLKPSNVLLDKDMTPKISDFGMARIFAKGVNEVNTTMVVGTYGYMSPEYSQEGTYSVKSDVFSFGVLILEILSGKRNKRFAGANNGLSLLGYAWKKWTKGEWGCVIDPILDPSSEGVKRFFQIGLLCVQDRPEDRPIMSWVVATLTSTTETISQPHPPGYFIDDSGFDSNTLSSSKNTQHTTVNYNDSFLINEPR